MVSIRRGGQKLFDVEMADSLFKRAKGIMFLKNFKPLLFIMPSTARHSFHSFFCPSFEVVFIDSKGFVVGLDAISGPKFFSCEKEFANVLELPVGFISKYRLKESERLEWL